MSESLLISTCIWNIALLKRPVGEVFIDLEERALLAHGATVDAPLVAEAPTLVVLPLHELSELCMSVSFDFLEMLHYQLRFDAGRPFPERSFIQIRNSKIGPLTSRPNSRSLSHRI